MFPQRKQIKRSELLEFILSPHDREYHKKFIQKEVKKVIEIIDNNGDIEAIEYETEPETDNETETDYDSDDSDTMIAIKKLYKKSEKSRQIGKRIMSMNFPGDDNNKNQELIFQQ
jgi:hypothetical protein